MSNHNKMLVALLFAFHAQIISSPASAKDIISVSAGVKAGNNQARLLVDVTEDNQGTGFIRAAGNYNRGKWVMNDPLPCGESIYWFETWSRRNFNIIPPFPTPGMKSGYLVAYFSVQGADTTTVASIQRDTKSTMKHASHWKGQDFGVRVQLTCN